MIYRYSIWCSSLLGLKRFQRRIFFKLILESHGIIGQQWMFLFFLHLIFCFFLQPLDSQIARKYPRKQVGREKISKNLSFMYSKLSLLFMSIPMNNELSSRQPVCSLGSHFARSHFARSHFARSHFARSHVAI